MKSKRFSEIHKVVNGEKYKICYDCENWFPLDEDNFYKNKKAKDGFHNYCKKCWKHRVTGWQKDNRDKMRMYFRKCDSQSYRKQLKREYSKKQKESGYFRKYQEQNKDKLHHYQLQRRMNKEHEISETEWFDCLDYFNNSCAYCGITEGEAFEKYNQLLHKEHVEHYGVNDITNCVPACKGCNSQKWEYDLNEWYNEDNPIYSKRRYNKIIKWIMSFTKDDVVSYSK